MDNKSMANMTRQQARITAHILAALALLGGLLVGHAYSTNLYLAGDTSIFQIAITLASGAILFFVLTAWYGYVRMETKASSNLAPVDINQLAGLPGLSGFAGFALVLILIMLSNGDTTDAALAATIAVMAMMRMDAEINK